MTQQAHSPNSGFSMGFMMGFMAGSFGTFLFTTETGRLLLARILEMGEEEGHDLLAEGQEIMHDLDLSYYWDSEGHAESADADQGSDYQSEKERHSDKRYFKRS